MTQTLAMQWRTLKRSRPGRRFRDRYEASHRGVEGVTLVQRFVRLLLAAVAIVIGIVLVFIPGPAILFFAIAGALLASESRGIARFFDWCEVKLRACWERLRR